MLGKYFFVVLLVICVPELANAYTFTPPMDANYTVQTGQTLQHVFNLTFSDFDISSEPLFVAVSSRSPFLSFAVQPQTAIVAENKTLSVVATVIIPQYFDAGVYNNSFMISITNSTDFLRHYANIILEVQPTINFSVSDSIFVNSTSGSYNYANFSIENRGNTDATVKIFVNSTQVNPDNSTNNLSFFINPPQSVVIFRNHTTRIPFYFQIPVNFTGQRNSSIMFSSEGSNISFVRLVQFSVEDRIPPEIINYTRLEKYDVMKSYEINVNARDNSDIENVTVTLCGETKRLKHITEISPVLYREDFYLGNAQICNYIITVTDIHGNINMINATASVSPVSGIEVKDFISLPRLKKESLLQTFLFSTPTPINVSISLASLIFTPKYVNVSINSTNTTEIDYLHISINNGGDNFLMTKGEVYNITANGKVYATVVGYYEGTYSAVIQVDFPPNAVESSSRKITLNGNIDVYSATPNYEGYLVERPARCISHDVGIYQNSSYDCTISYPIDSPIESLQFPFPKDYLESKVNSLTYEISKWRGNFDNSQFWLFFTWGIIALIAVISFVYFWILQRKV